MESWGASQLHPILYWILWIYLAYTCLATRSLAFEALKVYKAIQSGSIEKARVSSGNDRREKQISLPYLKFVMQQLKPSQKMQVMEDRPLYCAYLLAVQYSQWDTKLLIR